MLASYNSCSPERNNRCLLLPPLVVTLDAMGLGARTAAERKRRNWTQKQLCDRVPGLEQQALDRLEKRDSSRSAFAVGIADALQVPLRWLLSGEAETGQPASANPASAPTSELDQLVDALTNAIKTIPRAARLALAPTLSALALAPDSADLRADLVRALTLHQRRKSNHELYTEVDPNPNVVDIPRPPDRRVSSSTVPGPSRRAGDNPFTHKAVPDDRKPGNP